MDFLTVDSIDTFYGKVQALHAASLSIVEGRIVTLIGANGAGKSTMLRTISGLIKPARGKITFEGKRIDGMPAENIARMGITHVPEGRRIFPGLSVYENLELATTTWYRFGKKGGSELFDQVYTLFPVLKRRNRQLGWSLSGGEQQMLAIGRAMMARPRVILLDEPSLGLAPNLVDEVFETIMKINQLGTTILLVEQNANMALKIADFGYVLENGHVVLADVANQLAENADVRTAYLGGS